MYSLYWEKLGTGKYTGKMPSFSSVLEIYRDFVLGNLKFSRHSREAIFSSTAAMSYPNPNTILYLLCTILLEKVFSRSFFRTFCGNKFKQSVPFQQLRGNHLLRSSVFQEFFFAVSRII